MSTPSAPAPAPRPPLMRHGADRPVSGVAAGLARHLGMPAGRVRAALALLSLLGGAGLALYVWLWLLMPEEGPDGAPAADAPTLRGRAPRCSSGCARAAGRCCWPPWCSAWAC